MMIIVSSAVFESCWTSQAYILRWPDLAAMRMAFATHLLFTPI